MTQEEYKRILKDWRVQKEIEIYQNNRALAVPNTTYSAVILLSAAFVLLIVGIPLAIVFFAKLPVAVRAAAGALFVVVFAEFALRYLGIKIIECYQHYAKEETRRRCLCVPSCSEYAVLCFKRYELLHALIKIRRRLYITCHGSDYIVDWPE